MEPRRISTALILILVTFWFWHADFETKFSLAFQLILAVPRTLHALLLINIVFHETFSPERSAAAW